MNASQFFRILLVRKWTLLLVFAVTVTTTVVVSLLLTKSYTAETSLVVDFDTTDPLGRPAAPLAFSSMYMATQEDIITSSRVAAKVVSDLKLDRNPAAIAQFKKETEGNGTVRDWLAELLLKNLTVEPSRDSRIITLEYKSEDPKFAALVANAFANAYIETALELNNAPAKLNAQWFDDQLKTLREAAEQAQKRLTLYQNQHQIITADERLDTDTNKLSVLSHELVNAQAEVDTIRSKIQQAETLMLKGARDAETIPEVMNNAFIQGLKGQLLHRQAELDELSRSAGENHPSYKAAKAETENLRSKLASEIKNVVQSLENSLNLAHNRVTSLETSVKQQKENILTWKTQREEFSVLLNEAKNSQRSYDTAMQRANEIQLESRVNQTDVSILTEAIAPIEHASPRLLLNTVLSFFLGSVLAIAAALIRETLDRRVRTMEDVTETLDIPLLGVVRKDKDNTQDSPRESVKAAA
ncbi:chain length determinant protein EpsF [Pseudomonadota bacterium]